MFYIVALISLNNVTKAILYRICVGSTEVC